MGGNIESSVIGEIVSLVGVNIKSLLGGNKKTWWNKHTKYQWKEIIFISGTRNKSSMGGDIESLEGMTHRIIQFSWQI